MNKKTILIIIGFILAIILTAIITFLIVKKDNNEINFENTIETDNNNKNNNVSNDNSNNENNKIETIEKENVEEVTKDESSTSNKKEEKDVNNNEPSTNNNKTETNNTSSINTEKTEEDVINYVSEVSKSNNGNIIKEGFVKIIDFIFYGGKIYDKTFKEISNNAKIKIVSLALKIDSKIDEKFPNYKETISNKTDKTYMNIKNKLVTLYLDTTVKICSNNPKMCDDAKAGLKEIKATFGITWDFIKDITGVGITKLKDWYEIWREE